MKKKSRLLSEERIEAIMQSIPFPIFYSENETTERITSAIYIEEIGENSPLMIPEYLDLVKENGDGSETVARYVLADAYSEYGDTFPHINN